MASAAEFEIKRAFLSKRRFAVVGASKDQSKFGTKVLKWYQARDLDVTPVHPKEKELEGLPAIAILSQLPFPNQTAVSIITPPKVTISILRSAYDLKIPVLWLQPGAEDEEVLKYIKETDDMADRVVFGGPCILVEGDEIIKTIVEDVEVNKPMSSL